MSELLSVVIDLNAEKLSRLDFAKFFYSLMKFLNCFRLQAATNQFRIYASFPHNCYLLYPIEGSPVSALPISQVWKGSQQIDQPIQSCVVNANVSCLDLTTNRFPVISLFNKCCLRAWLPFWATKPLQHRWKKLRRADTVQLTLTKPFSKHSVLVKSGSSK